MQFRGAIKYGLVSATVLLGVAGRATAGVVAYAYAEQTISNVTISPTSAVTFTIVNPLATGTGDAASANGSGVSHNDALDTVESYVGTPPPAPENDFSKYATFAVASPLPSGTPPIGLTSASPLDNFTRGDVLISGLGTSSAQTSGVAESYINSVTGGSQATGSASLSATLSFSTSADTALNLGYAYSNDLYAYTAGGGQAQAYYKFDVTIKNAAGTTVFDSASPTTNVSSSSPPNGIELVHSGTNSFTTATLLAGETYTLTFSGSEATFVSATSSTPEPATLAGAGIAILAAGFVAHRNRKRA